MRIFGFFLFLCSLLGFGCFAEDEPLPPYVSPPGVISRVIEMGPEYGTQHYYDLETDSVVAIVDRNSWDIALGSSNLNRSVYLNHSKLMKVCDLGPVDFESAELPANPDWEIDASSGAEDSTAVGTWGEGTAGELASKNHVYIIDLGFSTSGQVLGKIKLQVLGFQNGAYQIRFSDYPTGQIQTLNVPIDIEYSLVYVKLADAGSVVNVAPKQGDWDLVFTQYTTMVPNPDNGIPEAYSVNGTLLNPYNVEAFRAFDQGFEEFSVGDLPQFDLSSRWDVIGYDWKRYDFNTASYLINADNLYVVKNRLGNYFKIRFTGFVNNAGQSGYIGLQVKRL